MLDVIQIHSLGGANILICYDCFSMYACLRKISHVVFDKKKLFWYVLSFTRGDYKFEIQKSRKIKYFYTIKGSPVIETVKKMFHLLKLRYFVFLHILIFLTYF